MNTTTANLNPNDRVLHPKFGLGTVLELDDKGRLSVQFDHAGAKWLVLKYAQLSRVTDEAEAVTADWLDTFVLDDSDDHAHGSRWEPFFDDTSELLVLLQQMLPEAKLRQGYGDFYPSPRACPAHWPKSAYLAWPDIHHGILAAIRLNDHGASELVSAFPFWESGAEHGVVLERVLVWSSGVEAQIECSLGDASVTFFDPLYALNRGWYRAGDEYRFVLTGIAYNCHKALDQTFDIPQTEVLDVLREMAVKEGGDPDDPELTRIHTRGMAALLPIPEWDVDDYHFRGPIKQVREIEMLGQPGWLVRATLLRSIDDDSEFDLDIVVMHKAWQGDEPPQPGKDIEGTMWLQGYLWSAMTA